MSFASDIRRWAKKSGIGLDRAVATVGIEIEAQAILASPVDTGQFRGGWNVSVNEPNLEVHEGNTQFPEPQAPSALANVKAGDTVYVANPLPYAKRLDEGWSAQAPIGISSVVIERVKSGVKAAGQ